MRTLEIDSAVLVVVDVQGKLASLMHDKEAVFAAQQRIVAAAKALGLPILWVEQNPTRMGPTIPELQGLLAGLQPIAKMSFSCCGEPRFVDALDAMARRQVLLCGIEAHVCVYQTAADLVRGGYEVQMLADAVSSRTEENRGVGLDKARAAGAAITSTETAIFELLKTAEHPAFRDILKIVK